MTLVQVNSEEHFNQIRELFLEYAASLDFNLCFQNFTLEISDLTSVYAKPRGCLFLALDSDKLAGCIALREINEYDCEMKRLYVRPKFRGKGLGRKLAESIILEARRIGYKRMLLDTISTMKEAIELYRSIGFSYTEPYRYNPVEGVLFMELKLA